MLMAKPVGALVHRLKTLSFTGRLCVFMVEPGTSVQVSSTRMKPVVITPETAVNNHLNALNALLPILSIDLNIDCFSSYKG